MTISTSPVLRLLLCISGTARDEVGRLGGKLPPFLVGQDKISRIFKENICQTPLPPSKSLVTPLVHMKMYRILNLFNCQASTLTLVFSFFPNVCLTFCCIFPTISAKTFSSKSNRKTRLCSSLSSRLQKEILFCLFTALRRGFINNSINKHRWQLKPRHNENPISSHLGMGSGMKNLKFYLKIP